MLSVTGESEEAMLLLGYMSIGVAHIALFSFIITQLLTIST